MTEYELDVVKKAMEQSLLVGAPGVSSIMRKAIISSVVLKVRRQLNLPTPSLKETSNG